MTRHEPRRASACRPRSVLSQGVEIEDYPGPVAAACGGGAFGFLGGRAIWRDVVGAEPIEKKLSEVARPWLRRLTAFVDETTVRSAASP